MLGLSACGESSKTLAVTTTTVQSPYDPHISLSDRLAPRGPRFVARGQATIRRVARADTGEDGWEKLAIATDAVAWAAGKRVGVATGGMRATDELPLRAATLRTVGSFGTASNPRHILRHGDDGTPTSYSNTDGAVTSSLRFTPRGVVLKFGGTGVVYYDMQRRFDLGGDQDQWWRFGPDGKLGRAASAGAAMTEQDAQDLGVEFVSGATLTAEQATLLQGWDDDNSGACWGADLSTCGDWVHDDVEIAFGAPQQSPQGEPAYYWKVRAPLTAAQLGQTLPTTLRDGHDNNDGRPTELGTYELWLSQYGGDGYLEYAAYGLFRLFDNIPRTPGATRHQAFAAGYDAFLDEDGLRTTDLAIPIAATFKGRTMARQLRNNDSETHIVIAGADVLRGDVELHACIGAGACTGHEVTGANRISGEISDLEMLRHDDVWIPWRRAASIPLLEGAIDAAGAFSGDMDHPRLSSGVVNSWDFDGGAGGYSRWGGNLYGPANDLEAAGWWHLRADHRTRRFLADVIGAFGAVCTEGCADN